MNGGIAMTEHPKRAKRWLRFSLATLLFVSLCIGGLLAGYQSGYRSGYTAGEATRYDETQVTETYSTTTLVWPDLSPYERAAQVSTLKELIENTIATAIWADGTGNEVRDFPQNQSLIVTAPGSAHREIRELMTQLEALGNRGGANDLLPILQSLAAQGKSQVSEFPVHAPKSSEAAHAWITKYFGKTVDGVADQWGEPEYRGKCTDAEFPEWSLDQQIATWSRGGGVAFLGLRYLEDGQLHLVAGWRDIL
jgi:hypothetical protein